MNFFGRRAALDPGMTLAVILLVSISYTASAPPVVAVVLSPQSAQQPAAAAEPTDSAAQNQAATSAQNPAATPKTTTPAPSQTPSNKKQTAVPTHRPSKKKKVNASNCTTGPTPSSNTGSSAPAPGTQTGAASGTTNCPPSKIVVRQGGTSDPSIQLAGGAVGDQAAQQRDNTNQYLNATEANLKKIGGQQLTQNQRDMVKQIHQFMAQSKSAAAAGDMEQARTLAWKAQLLSEELANPQK